MRAELCALLMLPGALGAAALASSGRLSLGDGGQDALPAALAQGRVTHFELPFQLSRKTQVWAEAEGIRFVDLGPDAAPEVFIDDHYVGPLHPEHGSSWRGPLTAELEAGPHKLVLRNAQVQDAEDFVLRRIFVYASAPAKEAAVQAPVKMEAPALPRSAPENGCDLKERRDWPKERKAGITLSVLSGQVIPSGNLVRLKSGEAWTCGLKVTGRSSKPLALLAHFAVGPGDKGRWILGLDPNPPPLVDEVGFKSARWERFRAELCAGTLILQFGTGPQWKTAWAQPEIDLEIGAQGVEVSLRPIP